MKSETIALHCGVAIHRDWGYPKAVAEHYRNLKEVCLLEGYDYSLVLKRVGDYMRQCFDREPKTRDIPLEQATADLQKFVDYWNQEM